MIPPTLIRLGAIAGNTVRELVRSKLLYALFVLTALLILSSLAIAQLTIGGWDRVIVDLGLAAVELGGVLMAVFVGVSLVAGEIDRRTVYPTLARPLSRGEFVLGRFFGLLGLIGFEVLVMTLLLAGLLRFTTFPVPAALFFASLLLLLELALVTAFSVFFGSFTTPGLAASFSLAMYLVGHFLADIRRSADRAHGFSASLIRAAWAILPDLELFNAKTAASSELPVTWAFSSHAIAYGVVYTAALLFLAIAIFERRDLK